MLHSLRCAINDVIFASHSLLLYGSQDFVFGRTPKPIRRCVHARRPTHQPGAAAVRVVKLARHRPCVAKTERPGQATRITGSLPTRDVDRCRHYTQVVDLSDKFILI